MTKGYVSWDDPRIGITEFPMTVKALDVVAAEEQKAEDRLDAAVQKLADKLETYKQNLEAADDYDPDYFDPKRELLFAGEDGNSFDEIVLDVREANKKVNEWKLIYEAILTTVYPPSEEEPVVPVEDEEVPEEGNGDV